MQYKVMMLFLNGLIAVGAMSCSVMAAMEYGFSALSVVSACIGIFSIFSIVILKTGFIAPYEHALTLLGEHGINIDQSLSNSLSALFHDMQGVKSYAEQCKLDLEDFTQKTEDALNQANEASKMAETSREEGMLEAATRLEAVVQRISMASERVSSLIGNIMDGADVQRDRLHETSIAMDEMNSAITEVSHGATEAAISVEQAKGIAADSADIVIQSKEAIGKVYSVAMTLKNDMTQLGERAQMIDQVIHLINDVADQTNLLALNAAIEAARAGEAGRGFAVVADEVRKLAEKTMAATREVSSSIEAIQNAVADNVTLMDDAVGLVDIASSLSGKSGDAAREIFHHTENNASKIADMAAAAEEQSVSSSGMNKSIVEVREAAVHIAENVHETSDAIEALGELAVQLGELIQDMKSSGSDTLVSWNSTLSVGVREIDEQHMRLVELLNTMYAAMKSGRGESVLAKLLDELVRYTVYHFDSEEKLMDKYGYPDKPAHRKEHEALKKQVGEFVGKYKKGEVPLSGDLIHFLKNWVVNHIKRTDKKYGPYFNKKGLV